MNKPISFYTTISTHSVAYDDICSAVGLGDLFSVVKLLSPFNVVNMTLKLKYVKIFEPKLGIPVLFKNTELQNG